MSRLYLRIYLAVLGSLLVFALLAGLTAGLFRIFDDDRDHGWFETGAEIAERLLPATRDPASISQELSFWHERTGFSLMLLTPQGKVIAEAGDLPPFVLRRATRRDHDGPMWGGLYRLTLQDGRQLIAAHEPGDFGWVRHLRWLAALIGIALAVGIAAYPLIRYLTRRLERLEDGVAAFGAGDLSARVDIKGRDEIARLGRTFNVSADRIKDLLHAHKTLLANASHELRSPLSRLRMAIEQLRTNNGETPVHAEIARNIGELDGLVEEILLASRLQANEASELKLETVDLVGLLAEECAPYRAELSVLDKTVPDVIGDARLLRRLFRNLLDNAARYGGSASAAVKVSSEGYNTRALVCDHGPGIPETEREKIFEPFYRPKALPESAGGAGLGLALVKQIAEKHGGSVQYLPRDGGGACFEVLLPLARP